MRRSSQLGVLNLAWALQRHEAMCFVVVHVATATSRNSLLDDRIICHAHARKPIITEKSPSRGVPKCVASVPSLRAGRRAHERLYVPWRGFALSAVSSFTVASSYTYHEIKYIESVTCALSPACRRANLCSPGIEPHSRCSAEADRCAPDTLGSRKYIEGPVYGCTLPSQFVRRGAFAVHCPPCFLPACGTWLAAARMVYKLYCCTAGSDCTQFLSYTSYWPWVVLERTGQ